MGILTPIAATAVGACVTGIAGGLLALSTAQSRLPAIMSWLTKPEPDLDGKVVLVCTGQLPAEGPDPAQVLRSTLQSEHGAVVMIDLRLARDAGEKQRRQAEELARRVPADFRREFTGDPIAVG